MGQRSAAASRQWNLSNSYGPRTAELETDQAVTAWWVLGLRWTGPGSADGLAPAGNEPVALPHPFRAPANRAWPRCRRGRSPCATVLPAGTAASGAPRAGSHGTQAAAGAGFGVQSIPLPTLNELYREFRVGNTATLANSNLRPETVFGVEAGVDVVGESYSFRVTGYRNSLDSLITNVTLSQTATAIVRQRANAAEAISRGFETEFRERWRKWTGELQYLFADSRYVTGFRVAQVPKHQGSAQLTWRGERSMVSVSARKPFLPVRRRYQHPPVPAGRLSGAATGGHSPAHQAFFRRRCSRERPGPPFLYRIHSNSQHRRSTSVACGRSLGRPTVRLLTI